MQETNARMKNAETYKEISIRDAVAPFFRRKRVLCVTFIAVFVVVPRGGEFCNHAAHDVSFVTPSRSRRT